MSLRRLLAIIRKETIQILRDRRTLATVITLPIIQLTLYGYLSTDVTHLPTVVFDQSRSAESRRLLETFTNTTYFTFRYVARSMREVEQFVDSGRARIGIVVPPDYATRLAAGEQAQVLVVVDASDPTIARTVLGVAGGVGNVLTRSLAIAAVQRAGGRALGVAQVDVRTRAWYNPNLRSVNFFVPGVMAIIVLFTTTFLSITVIVRERELGTLEQIVVTPIKPTELLLGKIIPLIGLGYLNITATLLMASLWFKVPIKGNLLLLYVLSLAFFFSSLGLGTLISTVSRTFGQAAQVAQIILLPSFLLSGILFPRESLPTVLQWLSYALPLTYFAIVVRGIILKGIGMEYLWPQVVVLVLLGLALFAFAITRFHKKLE